MQIMRNVFHLTAALGNPRWRHNLARVVLLCGLLPLGPLSAQQPPDAWNPQRTWVFAVGVLRFDDPKLHTWPDQGRVDEEMIKAYQARGVPADHIVFLKNEEATRARVTEKLVGTLHAAGPDDSFVFYYAGHGSRNYHDPARPVSFVTFDTASDWRLKTILDAIEQNFHGRRVLLTADCCYSGALAEEVRRHSPSKIAYAVLTSAQATSTSTGNWTFTQALTDLLNGNPLLDLNHDGGITLREAGDYANAEMAFGEGQLDTFTTTGSFPADLLMARTQGSPPAGREGERCEGRYEGKWYKVKILKAEPKRCFVTWMGWDKSFDSWLPDTELRPYTPRALKPGTPVAIEWAKNWYPGRVLRSELGLQLVHYEGYDDIDDEWVSPDRLKPK